ncbi:MAG: hypothetical protein WC578_06290 [Candidatus Omnitrophota bacterium]|jgi:tetratricopeptide (TPR) repeat protein
MSLLIFIFRVGWVISILILAYSKKSLELILLLFAAAVAVEGAMYSFALEEAKERVKIGSSFFNLEIPQFLVGIVMAGMILCFIYFTNSTKAKSEDELKWFIRQTISEESVADKNDETVDNRARTPKELISKANDEYYLDNFERCIEILDSINSNEEAILESKAYLKILSLYKLQLQRINLFENVKEENKNELDDLFNRYLTKYKDNCKFTTIYYHYGHFIWRILGDQNKALAIFDDIIKNYWYSEWIQGSLYYSSILYRKSGNLDEFKIATEQMKILSTRDGNLKIFETGETVDARGYAKKILKQWNIAETEDGSAPANDLSYIFKLKEDIQKVKI